MSSQCASNDSESRHPNQRAIRVFVSCTFRDMRHEREELEKKTFPELRRLCKAHGVLLVSIDLGWGATRFDGTPNEALSMSLFNVSRCLYFIGILGEQYGTEFNALDESLLQQYPWLAERAGRSFVELECVYGALGETHIARRAFFYFRSSSASKTAIANDSTTFERSVSVAASTTELLRSTKLMSLKHEIYATGALVREYVKPQELAKFVIMDLAAGIEEDFPVLSGNEKEP